MYIQNLWKKLFFTDRIDIISKTVLPMLVQYHIKIICKTKTYAEIALFLNINNHSQCMTQIQCGCGTD